MEDAYQKLSFNQVQENLKEVEGWQAIERDHHIRRTFKFPDFKSALDFVNVVGELAEEEGHHPNILLTWGKVEIELWTHSADGLTAKDFILAGKIDRARAGS